MTEHNRNNHKVENQTYQSNMIFVVDDDAALLRLIQKNLKRAGFKTTGALNGTEAVAQIINPPPTLLLLDYQLPDMTGRQVIEALSERQCHVPFIVTTGFGDERVAVELMKLGARDYLIKGTGFLDLLIPVVQQVVEQLAAENRLAVAEKELRTSEERFRLLYEQAPLGYQSLDEDGCLIEVNQAWLDLFGYNRNEVISKWFGDFLTPEYVDYLEERFLRFKAAGQIHDVEFEVVCKDKTHLIVSLNGRIGFDEHGDFQQTHCILQDITERKQAREELARRVDELDTLNKIGQAINSTLDLQKILTLITECTTRLLGVVAASVALYDKSNGDLWFAAASGEGADFVQDKRLTMGQGIVGQVIQHNEPMLVPNVAEDPRFYANFDQESGFKTRSILCVPLQTKGQAIGAIEALNKTDGFFDKEDRRLLNSLAASAAIAIENARLYQQAQQEIAERRQAEVSLRESEERFRSVVETANDAIIAIDSQSQIISWNKGAETIFGYPANEAIGQPMTLLIPKRFRGNHQNSLSQAASGEASNIIGKTVELIGLKKSGDKFPLELALTTWQSGEEVFFTGIIRDITERKQAETERERLLKAEREQRLQAETLAEVTLALTSQISHKDVLDEILRQMQRLVSYKTANIMLVEGDVMRIARWYGYQPFGIDNFMDNLIQPLADFAVDIKAIQSRQPIVIPDTHQDPRWVVIAETAWIRSSMVVPICLQDRVLGLLRLDGDTPAHFSSEDAERLQPLANAAAIALENARLYEQAQQELVVRKRAEEEVRRRNR